MLELVVNLCVSLFYSAYGIKSRNSCKVTHTGRNHRVFNPVREASGAFYDNRVTCYLINCRARSKQMALSKPILATAVCSATISLLYGCHALVSADSNANPPVGADCAVEFRPPIPNSWSSLYLKGKI